MQFNHPSAFPVARDLDRIKCLNYFISLSVGEYYSEKVPKSCGPNAGLLSLCSPLPSYVTSIYNPFDLQVSAVFILYMIKIGRSGTIYGIEQSFYPETLHVHPPHGKQPA